MNSHSIPEIRGDPSARIVAIVLWRPAPISRRTRRANSGSSSPITFYEGTGEEQIRTRESGAVPTEGCSWRSDPGTGNPREHVSVDVPHSPVFEEPADYAFWTLRSKMMRSPCSVNHGSTYSISSE